VSPGRRRAHGEWTGLLAGSLRDRRGGPAGEFGRRSRSGVATAGRQQWSGMATACQWAAVTAARHTSCSRGELGAGDACRGSDTFRSVRLILVQQVDLVIPLALLDANDQRMDRVRDISGKGIKLSVNGYSCVDSGAPGSSDLRQGGRTRAGVRIDALNVT
jgi:hypothetical protein